MTTFDGIGKITGAAPTNAYQSNVKRDSTHMGKNMTQFDSVMISANIKERDTRQKELVGRISRQVRTVTSSSELEQLHQTVADGIYQADPYEIAGRILLLAEDRK